MFGSFSVIAHVITIDFIKDNCGLSVISQYKRIDEWMYINEIFQIDDILEAEKRTYSEKGIRIINVSHWNAAPTYQEYILITWI